MELTEAITRFVAGGLLILVVSFIGQTDYKIISGIAVLFPIVTLTGYFFLSLDVSTQVLQEIVLFSIISVPTVWAFSIGVYYSLNYFDPVPSLIIGLISWVAVACVTILIDLSLAARESRRLRRA